MTLITIPLMTSLITLMSRYAMGGVYGMSRSASSP